MLLGFLGRPHFHRSVGCAPFAFEPSVIVVLQNKDPGVYREGPELLRTFRRSHLRKRYRDARRDGHRVDPSKALFKRLASRISVKGCSDPAFLRLRDTLRGWFPEETL